MLHAESIDAQCAALEICSVLQVYITVFADGPTRVLRFADVQNVGAEEAQQSILDLAARLKQVEEEEHNTLSHPFRDPQPPAE